MEDGNTQRWHSASLAAQAHSEPSKQQNATAASTSQNALSANDTAGSIYRSPHLLRLQGTRLKMLLVAFLLCTDKYLHSLLAGAALEDPPTCPYLAVAVKENSLRSHPLTLAEDELSASTTSSPVSQQCRDSEADHSLHSADAVAHQQPGAASDTVSLAAPSSLHGWHKMIGQSAVQQADSAAAQNAGMPWLSFAPRTPDLPASPCRSPACRETLSAATGTDVALSQPLSRHGASSGRGVAAIYPNPQKIDAYGCEQQQEQDTLVLAGDWSLPVRDQKVLLLETLRRAEVHRDEPPLSAQPQGAAAALRLRNETSSCVAVADEGCSFAAGSSARRLWDALGRHRATEKLLTELCCPITKAKSSSFCYPALSADSPLRTPRIC